MVRVYQPWFLSAKREFANSQVQDDARGKVSLRLTFPLQFRLGRQGGDSFPFYL
jgi:hypothetical protein